MSAQKTFGPNFSTQSVVLLAQRRSSENGMIMFGP